MHGLYAYFLRRRTRASSAQQPARAEPSKSAKTCPCRSGPKSTEQCVARLPPFGLTAPHSRQAAVAAWPNQIHTLGLAKASKSRRLGSAVTVESPSSGGRERHVPMENRTLNHPRQSQRCLFPWHIGATAVSSIVNLRCNSNTVCDKNGSSG